jgi:3'(2'), 5'-bisphosphate nucleotidase
MIKSVVAVVERAAVEVLSQYRRNATAPIDWKSDDSPLTQADRRSHTVLSQGLLRDYPQIPLLSEEGRCIPYSERRKWDSFWCIDPVDGTKEFIKRTGQFTINVALIEKGVPVLGVVYAPAIDIWYFADRDRGAWRLRGTSNLSRAEQIRAGQTHPEYPKPRIVASRDHCGPRVKRLLEAYPQAKVENIGSSLKFCMVADGSADLYYRDVPTCEWDTAAAQVIVECAGGNVFTEQGQRLTYNKNDGVNPGLITCGRGGHSWVEAIRRLDLSSA